MMIINYVHELDDFMQTIREERTYKVVVILASFFNQ